MIHHVSIGTNDAGRARAFWDPLMALLGFRLILEDASGVHYGTGDILFSLIVPSDGRAASPGNGVHIAFAARSRAMVDDAHRLALASGGTDDGPPGLRPVYDRHYYAAFFRDPEGNKIEAVTFAAE